MTGSAPDASPSRLVVVADDLTGAVEVAALLVAPDGTGPRVLLDASAAAIRVALAEPGALAIDADLRHLDPAAAEERLGAILGALPSDVRVLVKVDSLLRGPLGGIVAALRGRAPLLCTAVPATGRTVEGGVVRLAGTPLAATIAWRAEPRPAPGRVADAVPGIAHAHVPLDVVRGGELATALAEAAATGLVLADAETDDDLLALAAAAPGALVGAAGLARAWAARNAHRAVPDAGAVARDARPDPLCLIGTASAQAAAQVDACARAGVAVLRPPADAIAAARPAQGEPAVVAVPAEPADPATIEAGFGALARRAAGSRDLVLSGGATARAVLASLGVTVLAPVAEVHPGAVVSVATGPGADGRRAVTRPGSYGDPSSLQAAIASLTSDSQELS